MALIDAIRAHLLVHGPATPDALLTALRTSGATTAKTSSGIRSALVSSRLTRELADGRWDLRARRLAGSVLTTRPRSRLADGVLWVHRDLEPFSLLGTGLPLATGGVAQFRGSEVTTLVGPRGWLPEVSPGQLLALRWEGQALHVATVDEVPALDAPAVRRVQAVLRDHLTFARPSYYGASETVTDLCLIVLSALDEVPDLLASSLPPLRELLPLPERFAAETGVWEAHGPRTTLTLRVPPRVYDELQRRAGLLGDDVRDYAALLLGAAADRLVPAETCRSCRYEESWSYRSSSRYDDDRPYAWDDSAAAYESGPDASGPDVSASSGSVIRLLP